MGNPQHINATVVVSIAVLFRLETLREMIDQQHMNDVDSEAQRIFKVPLRLGDGVQACFGSP
ncbi:hypothetical protein GJ744_004096 [Endocarpon pusillum]|uniref:Uncharacterized protein n=1 Tax=Endocarpon pusillum TaxID=364733 RepID=A0A8H7ALU7_9EURO|nr:hypothetical protein GJ744_004096 [Endocarpon pusillum]